MTRGIYVGAMTPNSGKALVSLGLVDTLNGHADRVGFFRPIVDSPDIESDPMVQLMRRKFDLDENRARAGLSKAEARALLASGDRDEIDQRCVAIFAEMTKHCDIIVVEGTSIKGHDAAVEFDLNARLANNLGTPVLMVIGANTMTPSEAAGAVDVARKELAAAHCPILAIMVNRANPDQLEELAGEVRPGALGRPVYVIPEVPDISNPTVDGIVRHMGATVTGGSDQLDRDVRDVKVAAMGVANFLPLLQDDSLVIVPGDRVDVLLASLASSLSPEFPTPAGLMLTGGLQPDATVGRLVSSAPFPIMAVDDDTYTAARKVSEVRGEVSTGQSRKVAAALGAWSNSVDTAELVERLTLPRPEIRTPLRFLHELIERARAQRRHIVLPEGLDPRILRAAEIIIRRDICDLTILGPVEQVRQLAATEGVNLEGITLVDPVASELRERFAEEYAKLRAHKGVTLEQARERIVDVSYFGTMMVQLGMVDGMVSGAAHTTAHTIRPSLEFIKTVPGVKIVSSVFFMCLEDRVLVYGDCAVNPEPNEEQLADIALASAETAAQFGVEPRVAMLSYSTGGSGTGEAVDEVRKATEIVRGRRPDLAVEGPIQYDAAVDASIAASKLPGSSVAGQATVFIFPDLNTGNNTYKAVQQSSGAVAVGPVLQGLRKPVNDLSRGCTVDDIVNTVAITAIQGQDASSPAPRETQESTTTEGNTPA